jgi:hypothetical protein
VRARSQAAIAVTVVVVALYMAPYLAMWRAMRYSAVPPMLAPDLYLYLTLSQMPVLDGQMTNPWYGIQVSAREMPYYTFGRALWLFGRLDAMVGAVPWSLLLWNAILTALICMTAWWLFRTAGIIHPASLALAIAAITLVNFEVLNQLAILALRDYWIKPIVWVPIVWLPYVRFFLPQIAIPFVLCYLTLLLKVLRGGGRWLWAWMALIQVCVLVTFPFALFVVAGATAVAVLFTWRRRLWRVPDVAVFAAVCALSDGIFLARNSTGLRAKLFDLDAGKLLATGRLTPLVIAVLSMAVLRLVRDRELAAMIGGAGLAIAVSFGLDAVMSGEYLVTKHVLYLFHTVVALLVIVLVRDLAAMIRRDALRRALRFAALVATLACGVVGAFMTYKVWLVSNVARAELARVIGGARSNDLVIAATDDPVSEPTWLPLISKAQVLYCRDLDPSTGRADVPLRFALQLHLLGRSAAEVRADLLTYPERRPGAYSFLLGFRKMGLIGGRRSEEARSAVMRQLVPRLAWLESSPQAVGSLLARYDRIWVVNPRRSPLAESDVMKRHVQIWPVNQAEVIRRDVMSRHMLFERNIALTGWTVTIGRPSTYAATNLLRPTHARERGSAAAPASLRPSLP